MKHSAVIASLAISFAAVIAVDDSSNESCGPFQLSGNRGAAFLTPEGVVFPGSEDKVNGPHAEFVISKNGSLSLVDGRHCALAPFFICTYDELPSWEAHAGFDFYGEESFALRQYGALGFGPSNVTSTDLVNFLYCETKNLPKIEVPAGEPQAPSWGKLSMSFSKTIATPRRKTWVVLQNMAVKSWHGKRAGAEIETVMESMTVLMIMTGQTTRLSEQARPIQRQRRRLASPQPPSQIRKWPRKPQPPGSHQ